MNPLLKKSIKDLINQKKTIQDSTIYLPSWYESITRDRSMYTYSMRTNMSETIPERIPITVNKLLTYFLGNTMSLIKEQVAIRVLLGDKKYSDIYLPVRHIIGLTSEAIIKEINDNALFSSFKGHSAISRICVELDQQNMNKTKADNFYDDNYSPPKMDNYQSISIPMEEEPYIDSEVQVKTHVYSGKSLEGLYYHPDNKPYNPSAGIKVELAKVQKRPSLTETALNQTLENIGKIIKQENSKYNVVNEWNNYLKSEEYKA